MGLKKKKDGGQIKMLGKIGKSIVDESLGVNLASAKNIKQLQ